MAQLVFARCLYLDACAKFLQGLKHQGFGKPAVFQQWLRRR